MLRKQVEELQYQKERAERRLGELDTEIDYRYFSTHTIGNYKIQVVKRIE